MPTLSKSKVCFQEFKAEESVLFLINDSAFDSFSNSIALVNMYSTQATHVPVKDLFVQKLMQTDNFLRSSFISHTQQTHACQPATNSRLASFARAPCSFSFIAWPCTTASTQP